MTEKLQQITLDPASVALPGREELVLEGGGLSVFYEGIEYATQEIEPYSAEAVFGSPMIDFRIPNKVCKIPLVITATEDTTFDDWRVKLQARVSIFNTQGGGWLGRTLPSGRVIYADIISAKLKFGSKWAAENRDVDTQAVLELTILPDLYGSEVTEELGTSTGDLAKTILVPGDLPARVTDLKVTDGSGNNQLGLFWHFRCLNYSSAEMAEWIYNAESLELLDVAEKVTLAGSRGTKVVKHPNLSTSWTPVLGLTLASGNSLTHQGLYSLWVRVYTTSADPPAVRLLYDVGDIVAPAENVQVKVPGSNNFYDICLGQVNLQPNPFGQYRWKGVIQAIGEEGGENLSIDPLILLCGDENSGVLSAPLAFQTPLTGYELREEFNQAEHTLDGQPLGASGAVAGPLIPATIAEDATVGTLAWETLANARVTDGATAQVTITTGQVTKYIKVTKPGFAIPESAIITGIEATVSRAGGSLAEIHPSDYSVKIVKAGSITGAEHAASGNWPSSLGTRSYGSATDLWGTTWTPGQINAEGFGVALAATVTHVEAAAAAEVDGFAVTVYYDTGSGGINWATSGDSVDLKIIPATHTVERSEVSDANINTGRYAIAGTTSYTNITAGIKCKRQASAGGAGEEVRQGSLIRYVDEENWLMGCFDFVNTSGSGEDTLRILKRKSGVVTELVSKIIVPVSLSSAEWRSVWIEADPHGRILLWASTSGADTPTLQAVVFDTDLATGNALATGKVGFYDAKTGANANIREYDHSVAFAAERDAVIFANQSAHLSTKGMYRQSEDGKGTGPIANPGSDLPRLPVSGPEENLVEVALKVSRGIPGETPDPGLDKFSAQISYRPCWSQIPEQEGTESWSTSLG